MEVTPRILVVDDDQDTCRNLSDILNDLGYDVQTAHDGPAALDLVAQTRFDVALLDLKMPGMDGLTLYRRIKQQSPSTVAIIVSAYASPETETAAAAAGIWKIMHKPVDFSSLLPLVDEAISQPLVLVVDDDPDLCANLWDLLRDRGYRVSIAHSERQTEALLREGQYRVVLLDMKLPDSTGDRVFQRVRIVDPEARVVLITGFQSELEDVIRDVLRQGADAICYKPLDIQRLLETLRRLTSADPETL